MLLSKQSKLLSSRSVKATGFTLIEILITTALGLIILGGSLVSYNNYQNRQTLVNSGRDVIAFLQQAQTSSSAGEKPETGCGTLNGYRVRAVANSDTYFLSAICDGGAHELNIQQQQLSSGYIFRTTGFDVRYPVQPGPISGGDITVTITNVAGTGTGFRFKILQSGSVEETGQVSL